MQRDDVMTPIESLPCCRLDPLELRGDAADRFFPANFAPRVAGLLAHHRLQDAVAVVGVAPGEAALHAGMTVIGLAVLPRHHAHDLIAAHLRLEVAADAAIGAGGDDRVLRLAHSTTDFSISVAVGQACTQAPQETHSLVRNGSSMPAAILEAKPRPSMVSAKVPCTSSQARTQREQTMHFDGIELEIRIGPVDVGDARWLSPS